MSRCDVFISSLSFGAQDSIALDRLRQAGVSVARNDTGRRLAGSELAAMATGSRIVIAGTDDLALIVSESPTLKLIVRLGVGLDGVPLEECRDRGIAVVTTPAAVTDSVAEFTLGLIIAALRHIPSSDRGIRQTQWPRRLGRTVSDTTVGIVGFGRIGRRVADLLMPFQPKEILVTDVIPVDQVRGPATQVDLNTLALRSDVITLHMPLTDATRGLFGPREFDSMKSDAVFINTSRGGLVDESALLGKLRDHPDFVAALDVFIEEPYRGELAALQSTILTSHVASNTSRARADMERLAVDAVLEFLADSRSSEGV